VDGVTAVQAPQRVHEAFVLSAKPANETAAVRERILALASSKGLRLSSIREVQASLDEIYRRAVSARSKEAPPEVAA
jgi:hypothetical protein